MTEITTKTCSKCKVEKDPSDFNKCKAKLSGLQSRCRVCVKEDAKKNPENYAAYARAYRMKNPEKEAKRAHAYRIENPEKAAARKRSYRKNNAEKIAAYRKDNAEKISQNNRAYRIANSEKIKEMSRSYRNSNPEKIRESARKWDQNNPKNRVVSAARSFKKAKESLSDSYIKQLLGRSGKIPASLITQSLVELKRAQIQISNFLKEQAK